MRDANRLVKLIFFGNYFYGVCAVALSIEATLQQRYALNSFVYFVAVFVATVVYYNKAYITESLDNAGNARAKWYYDHRRAIATVQMILMLCLAGLAVAFITRHYREIFAARATDWLLLLVFPLAGVLYYGVGHTRMRQYNLRNIGWLKPFVIGFTWAGLVTVYPVLYYSVTHRAPLPVTLLGCLLFLKNFMYISMLSILFDIKDYTADHNQQLKTFVVKAGLRKTIFVIIIPLSIIGLGCFLTYGFTHNFSPMKIALNTIPFLLLIGVTYSMQRRKSLFFYLVLIDGLMLIKALFGIVAMRYF